jgi:hypothetical protein
LDSKFAAIVLWLDAEPHTKAVIDDYLARSAPPEYEVRQAADGDAGDGDAFVRYLLRFSDNPAQELYFTPCAEVPVKYRYVSAVRWI